QTYNPEIVVIATDESVITDLKAVGFIGSDAATSTNTRIASAPSPAAPANVDTKKDGIQTDISVYPNPFPSRATLSFSLSHSSTYLVSLFDEKGARVSVI